MQAFLKNENVPINSINDEGNTPLVIACIRGNTLIANILLEANALIVDNYKKKCTFLCL
ncbi:ankyrin repeat domain-containing protein [Fusobacterium polymorphum]